MKRVAGDASRPFTLRSAWHLGAIKIRFPDMAALGFEERLALMVDREAIERENKRLVSRLKFASMRQSAVVEDVDIKAQRGLDKALFAKLVAGDWIGCDAQAEDLPNNLFFQGIFRVGGGDDDAKV